MAVILGSVGFHWDIPNLRGHFDLRHLSWICLSVHCHCLDWCSRSKRDRGRTVGNSEWLCVHAVDCGVELCSKWKEKVCFQLLIPAFLTEEITPAICFFSLSHVTFVRSFFRVDFVRLRLSVVVSTHLAFSLAALAGHEIKPKKPRGSRMGRNYIPFLFFSFIDS